MGKLIACVCFFIVLEYVNSYECSNETVDAVSQQLAEFRSRHPRPIGVWTKHNGDPIDIRDTITLNSDVFNNKHHFLLTSHVDRERIPERVVHAKGVGAYGYFEVTHDVSRYIKADVFNGIGKKTPVVGRFSTATQNLGGTDLGREMKGVALKFYTNEGNLDLICLNIPILYKDPIDFLSFIRSFRRNPRTGIFDNTMRWDFMIMRPHVLHIIMWLQSDLGLPDGYRKMNNFPIHAYEVYNKKGDRYYVKFNFRTEIGLFNLTNAQAQAIGTEDPDYYNRDLYNAIAAGNYPSWRLEMDILTKDDLTKIDYDPFDLTRQWKRGTYRTVTVGKLVFNRRVDNVFKDVEQAAFNPDNLVPGIVGPPDSLFKARRVFYPDTQHYRLGANHANTGVNAPIYDRNYNRDGKPPVLDNMKDAPNYYPNSFNGPMPYVDEARPTERLFVLQNTAVDLQPMSEFYNEIVESDAHRQRIANNFAASFEGVPSDIERKGLKLLSLVDPDLGRRVKIALNIAKAKAMIPLKERYDSRAQCLSTT
ncbi:catalase-like [Helicoverpa zea]|uniref:catalase-like n=1 Tax=Helicoverpa zea TaxID=7113 RepID=UPI001F576E6D|nr:catalase-like [Helicoverpa zea]